MFRECLALVKRGVPFDVAFSVDESWRLAALVAFGEIEGEDWDWKNLRWLEQKS